MEGGKSMPRPGHVSQLRQNWSVFEDEAFATKIQHEEINQHYHGNRYRNQQIRDDIPQARRVQSIEEQKANQEHFNYKQQQRHGNTNYHNGRVEDDDVQHDMSYHDLGGG